MARKLSLPLVAAVAVAMLLPRTSWAQDDAERQIALAVMALPPADQAGATVLGYRDGEMVTLREGAGSFICLADQPGNERFQVACYHVSLEPYMARGRELRAEGITGQTSIRTRWAEVENGTLQMPSRAATLYQIAGDPATVEPGSTEGMRRLTVIYMPYATAEETGLSAVPGPGMPWIMYPGTPTAHVMISQ